MKFSLLEEILLTDVGSESDVHTTNTNKSYVCFKKIFLEQGLQLSGTASALHVEDPWFNPWRLSLKGVGNS